MAVAEIIFIFIFFSFFLQPTTSVEICPVSCGNDLIRFPFRLNNQDDRCGYPGFNLSCKDQTQTIISFPFSGDFGVVGIDYMFQDILVNDPNSCLPKRLLMGLNLSGTPFDLLFPRNYTFLNCSSALPTELPEARYISCLSGRNFSVLAIPTARFDLATSLSLLLVCSEIGTALLPLSWTTWSEPGYGIRLTWNEPNCLLCESREGTCTFENDTGLNVGCSGGFRNGLSRGARYVLMLGIGIPLLLFLAFIIYLRTKVRDDHIHQYPNPPPRVPVPEALANSVTPRLDSTVANGLDGKTIEAYPILLLGESKRLPRPQDNTCPICLSEYQAKDKLRTLPDCKHYFHAVCIDEWLKLNAACPLCRNTPERLSPNIVESSFSSSVLH